MIRVIIIDDEFHARKMIADMVKLYMTDAAIVAEADGVENGYEQIIRHNPDLVFLDIKMGNTTGFNLLEKFRTINFKVIFVTAFDEYAIKAFKFSAIDYILKPINEKEFAETCYKFKNLTDNNSQKDKLKAFNSLYYYNDSEDRVIPINTPDKLLFIKIKDIQWLESERNYTILYTTSKAKHFVSKTLGEFEDMFERFGFFRIHHSYLINLRYISYFDKINGVNLVMLDGSVIPVASRRKASLVKLLNNF